MKTGKISKEDAKLIKSFRFRRAEIARIFGVPARLLIPEGGIVSDGRERAALESRWIKEMTVRRRMK